MVRTGMLNRVLATKPQRDTWFEVNNQILNAFFTLMCLYQHPRRFYHLALLCRWRAGDMLQLRQVYCKDGTCKPSERKHITVVVLLLQLNCFAQYALCGLNLGYRRPERPVIGVALTISVAICAPAVAGLYNNLSPLGNDYEAQASQAYDDDEEEEASSSSCNNNNNNPRQLQRKRRKSSSLDKQQSREWAGGLLDVWDDMSLAYLSVLCSCCVFGWNMSRLGFGNMYVHIATFLLLCLAPFFIFDLAAVNIDNEDIRDALGLAGVFLCVLGLLYGGFWRIQRAPEVPSAGEPRLLRQAGPHRLPAVALLLPMRSGSGSPHGRRSGSSSCKTSSINQR
jgi:Cys-rich protein (TIGR01571 family)